MNRREAEDIALTDAGLRFGSRVRLITAARDIPYGGGGGGAGGFARGTRRETRRCLDRRARRLNFSSRATTVASSAARGTAPPPPRSFVPRDPLDAGAGVGGGGVSPVVSLHFNPTFPPRASRRGRTVRWRCTRRRRRRRFVDGTGSRRGGWWRCAGPPRGRPRFSSWTIDVSSPRSISCRRRRANRRTSRLLANAKKSRRWNSPRRRPRGARRGGATATAPLQPRVRRRARGRARVGAEFRRDDAGGGGDDARDGTRVGDGSGATGGGDAATLSSRALVRASRRLSCVRVVHAKHRGMVSVARVSVVFIHSRAEESQFSRRASIPRRMFATRFALVLRSLAASPPPRARVPGPPACHSPRRLGLALLLSGHRRWRRGQRYSSRRPALVLVPVRVPVPVLVGDPVEGGSSRRRPRRATVTLCTFCLYRVSMPTASHASANERGDSPVRSERARESRHNSAAFRSSRLSRVDSPERQTRHRGSSTVGSSEFDWTRSTVVAHLAARRTRARGP